MVWTHYLLRNTLGGTSGVRVYGVRQNTGSSFGRLRQRSSLALRRPLRQLQPQLNYLPEQISKASPSFATGVKDTNRHKSTATAVPVGKATAIDAMTQEASGTTAGVGVTSAAAANSAANDAKKSAPAPEKLWIVGRLMEGLDERLGAKQEKLRIHEIGVIERFSSVISVLDGSLEAREGDDFLDWLTCQESQSLAPAHGNTRDVDSEGRSGKGDADGGGGARKERENVTKFLSDAAARLNELVALREDSLFRDRGEPLVAAEKEGEGAESESLGGEADSVSPSIMPEELLYQAKLAAHRAFLSQCFSALSIYLAKEQLKAGLTVEEVVIFARSAYLASPQDRLGAIFPLFDIHRDGHLDADSVERAVDAMVNSMVLATERCYAAAARSALDKKASKAMPATMKYVLWDVLEVPVKRRCAFAWADGRKQVGPDEWRVSWEQFAPSRIQNFPELESIMTKYMAEYSKRRSEWHNKRKARKSSIVYGSALFFAVISADHLSTLV